MIAKETIQAIKDKDLLDVCGSLGIELRKNGKNYVALCPFHIENSASFSINTQKNLWYCFGCGEGGDSIKLYMKMKNVGFVKAIDELNKL